MRIAAVTSLLIGALAGSAQAQLWNTGAFDGNNGRASDHPDQPTRPDTRAADDFVLAPGNGQPYSISAIRGRVLARRYTTLFAEIYADAGGHPAATPLATLPQSTVQVLQTGIFSQYDLLDAAFTPGTLTLQPGRYWLSIACNVSGALSPNDGYGYFASAGAGQVQGLEGMYRVGPGVWTPITTAFGAPSDFSFRIDGQQSQTCYANCDGSTAPPVLNVSDFICFQQHYLAGDSYANCDGNTNPPLLNINDFLCFQQRYSAGCP